MAASGAILREVGTTNRTFIKDFEGALSEKAGLLMKAHTSNYRIRGFVHEASTEELIQLGRGHEIPVYYDPLIAKLIAHAETREQAIERARLAGGSGRFRLIPCRLAVSAAESSAGSAGAAGAS